MGLKKLLAGLVAVVALLGVTGCSQSGNVAATVDGTVITENFVQNSAREIADVLSPDPKYDTYDFVGFVLGNSIMEKMLTDCLDQMGITLSDQDRERMWTSSYAPDSVEYALWTNPKTQPAITGLIDLTLVNGMAQAGSLDTNQFLALIDAMPITINPRYGQWDPERLSLSSRITNSPAGPLADPTTFIVPNE